MNVIQAPSYSRRRFALAVPLAALALVASSCTNTEAEAASIDITSADATCEASSSSAEAGTARFTIKNVGTKVTEMYVHGADDRVLGEVENIDPGKSKDLTVQLTAGDYEIECKPGMTGEGIRTKLSVTGESDAPVDPRLTAGTERYKAYVQNQVNALVISSEAFANAVKSGDTERAKALYGPSRIPWERIEPVAESFGDIDPKVDARENDVEPGQTFTGWHRLERDLWVNGLQPDSGQIADQLMTDLRSLQVQVETLELDAAQLANGSKELMEEVATGKVTGEEERYSHLDLLDFQANLEGSKEAFDSLRPFVIERDSALAGELDGKFDDVAVALLPYRQGESFVTYDKLTPDQIKALADRVDALNEPLSRLTSVVAS